MTRTPLAHIALVLRLADRLGVDSAARRTGHGSDSLRQWRRRVAAEPGWLSAEAIRVDSIERAALAERRAKRRAAQPYIDATGTRRRLQGLMALGWRQGDLAARLGLTQQAIDSLIRGRRSPRVTRATADKIAALYEHLSMSIGPSRITRDRALRAGYVPPLAWDDDQLDNPHAQPHAGDSITGLDEAAIERRAAGDTTVPLTHPERRELVRRLHATGLNHTEIAQRAGINARQVYRDLHRTKEETAA